MRRDGGRGGDEEEGENERKRSQHNVNNTERSFE